MAGKKAYIKDGKNAGRIGIVTQNRDVRSNDRYKIQFEDKSTVDVSEHDLVFISQPGHIFRRWKWVIIIFLSLLAFVFGMIGFAIAFREKQVVYNIFTLLYLSMQLFTVQMGYVPAHMNWQLELARFLGPIVFFYTIWQTIAAVIAHQMEMTRLRFLRDHVIICGLGQKGLLLAKSFCRTGHKVVIIEVDPTNVYARQCREWGAIILFGDASDCEMLRKARLDTARYLIAFCDNDGINSQIAVNTHNLCMSRSGFPLTCYVHIADPELCDLLKEQEIIFGKGDSFRHEYFNIYRLAAKSLLLAYPLPPTAAAPHLLIVGLGNWGRV